MGAGDSHRGDRCAGDSCPRDRCPRDRCWGDRYPFGSRRSDRRPHSQNHGFCLPATTNYVSHETLAGHSGAPDAVYDLYDDGILVLIQKPHFSPCSGSGNKQLIEMKITNRHVTFWAVKECSN